MQPPPSLRASKGQLQFSSMLPMPPEAQTNLAVSTNPGGWRAIGRSELRGSPYVGRHLRPSDSDVSSAPISTR
jgi:hypothetical protein